MGTVIHFTSSENLRQTMGQHCNEEQGTQSFEKKLSQVLEGGALLFY